MRRQDAQVLALHQLQDGLCFHACREEEESAERVGWVFFFTCFGEGDSSNGLFRAKYIEGLENRLGRMESLLRLSGLLSEDDSGKTDLGTLEKRLADRTNALNATRNATPNKVPGPGATQQGVPSHNTTPRMDAQSSPHTAPTSPESHKESETEVEALSDMMCSLVTNNCGETRYIGMVLIDLPSGFFNADLVF